MSATIRRRLVGLLVPCLVYASALSPAYAAPAHRIDLFPTDDGVPLVIAAGPVGSNVLWATVDDEPTLLQIALAPNGAAPNIRSVDMPDTLGDPRQLILGPDGNLWITGNGGVARMTPAGAVTLSAHTHGDAFGITAGPDGKMWFSYGKKDAAFGAVGRSLGRLTTDLAGFDTVDISKHGLQLVFLTKGPDGNIWGISPCFFDGECSIARIAASGDIKVFKRPPQSRPYAITASPDGALWYADYGTNAIVRLDPVTGEMKEHALEAGSDPTFVTVGPDGALWFTASGACKVGRMTLDGKVDMIPVAAKKCEVFGITVGPDGNIWFTAAKPDAIGRVKLR